MKKLVLMLAVAFSVSLFSCGGNAEKECCDSCKQDTVEATAPVDTPAVADTNAVVDTPAVAE